MNRNRIPLDIYDNKPSGMRKYIQNYGYHFNKKATEYAVSRMKRYNSTTAKLEKIEYIDKEHVEELMTKYGVSLKYNELYDFVYVFNMAKSDFFKSSLPTEEMLCKFVADYVDDPDQSDGFIFNRWYADCVHAGIPIEWDDIL